MLSTSRRLLYHCSSCIRNTPTCNVDRLAALNKPLTLAVSTFVMDWHTSFLCTSSAYKTPVWQLCGYQWCTGKSAASAKPKTGFYPVTTTQWLVMKKFKFNILNSLNNNLSYINKQIWIYTLSGSTEQFPLLLHELHVEADFWPFTVDLLRLFFLPIARTALHAEARCDRGKVTYNKSYRKLNDVQYIIWLSK